MNTLKIENLFKTYSNGVQALENINLNITNGMFGLLGANGAGKSTLMRTIAALQKPTTGDIVFNEVNIVENEQKVRNHLGYLPQEFGVYPKISAQKLLDHLAVLKGILNKKERKKQVEMLLQQTNLYQHRKKSVHTFSGGMKQRFGIAQALLGDPQLIIVDEPTAGLDPEERNRFLNLLSDIGQNIIVILSTHIVEDIQELCTQMAILANGKIISEGNPKELVETIRGKIWSKIIPKGQLPEYNKKYPVISTRLIAGETQIRVISETQPDDDFKIVNAGLEDYYFTQIHFVNSSKKK
ncbi:ABC transporter ATP-binding protein [Spongiivirga sp. MCCC 1A20706]|uniref:ABC transporter ATP-binding protein n=1 Tax=Spongiivirga sp. MCCC 1A20706 TaxID=3160963 RepID=UPI0039779634